MIRWTVYTPEREKYAATETDPPEYGADVVEVEANTRRDAILFGVRLMLKNDPDHGYCGLQRQDGLSPYAGVKAEVAFGDPAWKPGPDFSEESGGYRA